KKCGKRRAPRLQPGTPGRRSPRSSEPVWTPTSTGWRRSPRAGEEPQRQEGKTRGTRHEATCEPTVLRRRRALACDGRVARVVGSGVRARRRGEQGGPGGSPEGRAGRPATAPTRPERRDGPAVRAAVRPAVPTALPYGTAL